MFPFSEPELIFSKQVKQYAFDYKGIKKNNTMISVLVF